MPEAAYASETRMPPAALLRVSTHRVTPNKQALRVSTRRFRKLKLKRRAIEEYERLGVTKIPTSA